MSIRESMTKMEERGEDEKQKAEKRREDEKRLKENILFRKVEAVDVV